MSLQVLLTLEIVTNYWELTFLNQHSLTSKGNETKSDDVHLRLDLCLGVTFV